MNIYILYFLTGAMGGFIGGFLGLGGGIIFVPSLFFIFSYHNIHPDHIMQSAICTSLLCVVISSFSSALKHKKNNLINWRLFRKMLPGILIGSLIGIIFISYVPSRILTMMYGSFLVCISVYIFYDSQIELKNIKELKYVGVFSFATGAISSILGIGGGTMTTPYFKYHGESLKRSIGTAAACGVPIALTGIVSILLIDLIFNINDINIISYLHLESFIIISLITMIFSYIGAGVTKISNTILLKNIFGLTLILIGLVILFF